MDSLSGQKLVRFSIRSRGDECVFEFDLGGMLITRASGTDYTQWTLFEPSGLCLTLRGDKNFHTFVQTTLRRRPWKPIFVRTKV